MGELLEGLRLCGRLPGSARCRKMQPLASEIATFVRRYYGGPIRSVFKCPPGDPPSRPKRVHDETAAHVAGLLADSPELRSELEGEGDAELDLRAYIIEQFEAARSAHEARVGFCATGEAPEPPGYPPIDEPEAAERAGREEPNDKPAEASTGWLWAAAGLALIVASRIKRS